MKNVGEALVIAFLVTVWTSTAHAAEANPTEPAYTYRANVVDIIDGDTIDVDIDLGFYIWARKQRIRLLDIDAPEPKGETKTEGDAATAYLKGLIAAKTIILKTVKGKDGADRDDSFGRWLGIVYIDGRNVNKLMIESGHAVPYTDR